MEGGIKRHGAQVAIFLSTFTLRGVAYGLDASTRLTEATISNVIKDWILPTWSTSVRQVREIGTFVLRGGSHVDKHVAYVATKYVKNNTHQGQVMYKGMRLG